MPQRLDAVLSVIYLVFNESYSTSAGAELTRADQSGEAIRLGRLLAELLPDAEVTGLLALMLLHESRRIARATPDGDLVLLEDQDRSLWNQVQIREGARLVQQALATRPFAPYAIQAAIATVHAEGPSAKSTDWSKRSSTKVSWQAITGRTQRGLNCADHSAETTKPEDLTSKRRT